MPASLYYVRIQETARRCCFHFQVFVYDNYLPIRLPRNLKCVTSGDVGRDRRSGI